MKLDTVFKFYYTFEYWDLIADPSGGTKYAYKDTRTGMLLPGGVAGSSLITKEALTAPMQVRNVRDRSGTPVFVMSGEPFPMYVTSVEPQVDPFSNVIAYRHQLRKDLPREYSEFLQRVLDSP